MRVGVIQSNYIPWRGYFDFIDSVDIFIFYDDCQYTKQSWRNRNKVKTSNGLCWLTVPVHQRNIMQTIDTIEIDYSHKWIEKHIRTMRQAYEKTPYFEKYFSEYTKILNSGFLGISRLNQALIRWITSCLGIDTILRSSSEFHVSGRSTERLIGLLLQVGATNYLSGPAAAAYLDLDRFRDANITLEYKTYDYPQYPQPHGVFAGEVTILDLLFCMGPSARNYMKSLTPHKVIVDCSGQR